MTTNWAGNVEFASELRQPRTVEELPGLGRFFVVAGVAGGLPTRPWRDGVHFDRT